MTENRSFVGRWSHGPHMDNQFSVTREDRPNMTDKQRQRKLRKEDILQEHKEILSHLDDIMLRAKAAMTKSSDINKQIGDIDSSYQQTSQETGISHEQSPEQPTISQSDTAIQNIPKKTPKNQVQIQNSQNQASNGGVGRNEELPSIIESHGSQYRSPMTDQLRLAQIRLRKQQELLEIQQQQIHAMSKNSPIGPGFTCRTSIGQREMSEPFEQEESRYMDIKIVENGLEPNNSNGSLDKSLKLHPDDRKPKLSGTDITKLVHKNYDVVIPKGSGKEMSNTASAVKVNDTKDDELERSLPPAEDFLKSLAEMKLAKRPTNVEGTENKSATTSNTQLTQQQLAQLSEHFKRLGIDTRPFQDLLGSPSNTRDGKSTAFQPFERKPNVRKQLSCPENSDRISEQRRASADGKENDSHVKSFVKQVVVGSEKHPTAVVAPTSTERDSHSVVRAIPQTGTISQGANFIPIEPHPVTTQSKPREPSRNTSGSGAEINQNPTDNLPAGGSKMIESLKLDLAGLSDVDPSEQRERYVITAKYGNNQLSSENVGDCSK